MSILELLSAAKELVELELHLYGNLFSKPILKALIDWLKELPLKKLILSIFEFSHQEFQDDNKDLLEAFAALEVEDKKLV